MTLQARAERMWLPGPSSDSERFCERVARALRDVLMHVGLVACCSTITCAAVGCAHVSSREPSAERALEVEELLVVAGAAEQLGDGLRAQQYLLSALRLGADAQRVLPWLLRLYVADSQYRLAIDTARDYLRVHPRDTRLRMLLAGLYEATELEAGALEQYERVIAASPEEARAHFALASLLHERGREPGRADTHFRAYLSLEPRGENADEARAALLTELP